MALKTYNRAPYYDDFDQTKNYMRILFRPGYSVQARELTQMQTAIQAQIDRFGRHVFKEGSPVIGGLATLDTRFAYVKLESGGTPDPDNFYTSLIGTTVTGGTSGITATVLDATPPVGSDPLTLFVKYTSTATLGVYDGITQFFLAGEILTSDDAESHAVTVAALETDPVGYGCRVSVSEGAYFVAGNFVYNAAESIILEKYTTDANARVVYIVHEDVVGSAMDPTLKDNAAGSPNDSAPGADRYSITLELHQQPIELADRDEANIIQLLLVEHGKVRAAVRTQYSELGDILAKRTYEESGNYTVRPFQINIKEYLNDGTNGGQYTASEITAKIPDFGTDANATAYGDRRLAVGLEPSVAYVNGYRIQLEDTAYVPVEKARDEDTLAEQSFAATYKNYIDVNSTVGLPDIVEFTPLQLRKSDNTLIGSARARSFKWVSGTTYRLYLFDVLLSGGYAYSDIAKVYHSYGSLDAFSANVVSSSLGAAPNSMLFRLPVNNVKTIKPESTIRTVYDARIKKHATVTTSSTTISLTARTGDTFANTFENDWIAINEANGSIVTITDITPNGALTTATVTFSGLSSGAVTIIVPVRRALYTQRTKTYYTNGAVTIAGTPNLVANGYDSLGQTDVLRVKGVYMSADFTTAPDIAVNPNIVDRYILDNGQRDNMYDIARLQLKPGASAPTGRIRVTYDYFTHGSGDYFSVDSYTASFGDYENIPSFQSSLGMVQLRDVLDFRPTRSLAGTDFSSPGAPIDPDSTISADIVYYMPRIDKIFVNKDGQFGVVKGISSTNPVAPEDPKDAMVLYVLRLGAYTFNAADTIPSMVDNKRYTMRDIGKIEKRVSKLEYYTSLSLLEKDTVGTQIFDGASVRYKNGFVVDSFYGHNVGAITDPDYTVSMDKATGKLRPMFYEDNARLILNSNTNLRQTGSLLTLNYYQTNAIVQPYASSSEYINPYNVFNWTGDLTLSPNTDEWKETKRAPDVVIDQTGIYDTLVSMLDQTGAIGTVWNEWQTNWSGSEQVSDTTTKLYNGNPLISVADISTTITTTTTAQQSRNGVRTSIVPDTITTDMGDKVVEINFVPFIRSRKIYFKATRLKPNTKMYAFFDGINMASYVRDESGTSNDGFVKYSDRTDVENYLDAPSHPGVATDLITDDTGTLVGSFVIPNTSTLKFKTGPRIFRLTNSSDNKKNPDTSAETQYFAQGTMNTIEHSVVSTRVPQINRTQVNDQKVTVDRSSNTSTEQFYRWNIPTFTDPTPDPLPPAAPPPAPPTPPVDPIVPDPVIPDWTPPVDPVEPVIGERGRFSWEDDFNAPAYIDPLAQSFMIDSRQGAFVTSLDLYFAAKDDEVPVTIQIRVMVNGAPTPTVVPFSQVTMPAVDINVTETATVPTTFTFESPVYLMQGVEYCFVVLSNSNKPKIFISELGEYDVTAPSFRITKQPYDGVMFKSANASTWTPEQTKDIKFTLRRAAFAQTGTATFVNAPTPSATLSNPIQTTLSSGIVRVLHKNHGHFAGSSKVTFSGIEENDGSGTGTLNGLSISALNTTHDIDDVEIDSYTISITGGSASKTGRAGGTSVRATENKTFNVLHPIIQQSIIPATNINWKAKVTSGESLSGQGDPHNVSEYIDVKVNDNIYFNSPQTIVSQPHVSPTSILSNSEQYSMYFEGTLTTALENISPVIDLDRVSVVTVANRIDNPAASATPGVSNAVNNFIAETESSGGSRLSKYITRKIELNDPATSLHIYTLVNQPTGAGIELFYKTLPNGSDAKFEDLPWIGHATIANAGVSPDNPIPTTDNSNDYTEAQYNILDMAEFSAFAVKITFTAQNSSAVPTCRDFRAIAST